MTGRDNPVPSTVGDVYNAPPRGVGRPPAVRVRARAAFAWAVSPIFIRHGLEEVTSHPRRHGRAAAASVAFGVALLVRGRSASPLAAPKLLAWKAVAGIIVGVATWARWYALSLTTVVVVLSLALLSVPTVLLLAPIVAGRHLERITVPVVIGSAFVVGGSLVLIAQGVNR
jgi:uncharacterized membrane protein